jgi:hypothetical protein
VARALEPLLLALRLVDRERPVRPGHLGRREHLRRPERPVRREYLGHREHLGPLERLVRPEYPERRELLLIQQYRGRLERREHRHRRLRRHRHKAFTGGVGSVAVGH